MAGDAGGVQSNDGRTTVDVAPGAVDGDVILAHTPWVVEAPENKVGIGHSFDITAVFCDTGDPADLYPGATFDLTIEYSDDELTTAMREDRLTLYNWNGDEWVAEPTGQVDTANSIITATPDRFSIWAVFGEKYWTHMPVVARDYD